MSTLLLTSLEVVCSHCDSLNAIGAQACSSCKAPVVPQASAPPPPQTNAPSSMAQAVSASASAEPPHAPKPSQAASSSPGAAPAKQAPAAPAGPVPPGMRPAPRPASPVGQAQGAGAGPTPAPVPVAAPAAQATVKTAPQTSVPPPPAPRAAAGQPAANPASRTSAPAPTAAPAPAAPAPAAAPARPPAAAPRPTAAAAAASAPSQPTAAPAPQPPGGSPSAPASTRAPASPAAATSSAPPARAAPAPAAAKAPAGPRFGLTVVDGPARGQSFRLPNAPTTIGRSQALILFPEDVFVSPLHATLTARDGRLFIRDESSVSGTFVAIASQEPLPPHTYFCVGQRLFFFAGPIDHPGPTPAGRVTPYGAPIPPGQLHCRIDEILVGGRQGRSILSTGPSVVVGQGPGDLSYPHDARLAPRHCELALNEKGAATLRDLSGGLGTYIRLPTGTERPLRPGDRFRIGQQVLQVEQLNAPSA